MIQELKPSDCPFKMGTKEANDWIRNVCIPNQRVSTIYDDSREIHEKRNAIVKEQTQRSEKELRADSILQEVAGDINAPSFLERTNSIIGDIQDRFYVVPFTNVPDVLPVRQNKGYTVVFVDGSMNGKVQAYTDFPWQIVFPKQNRSIGQVWWTNTPQVQVDMVYDIYVPSGYKIFLRDRQTLEYVTANIYKLKEN